MIGQRSDGPHNGNVHNLKPITSDDAEWSHAVRYEDITNQGTKMNRSSESTAMAPTNMNHTRFQIIVPYVFLCEPGELRRVHH